MKKTLSILFLLAGIVSISIANPPAKGYEGTWDYTVTDTPDGTYKGQLVIEKDGDSYKGKMVVEEGSVDVQNLKIDGDKMTFKIPFQDFMCYITVTRDGKSFKGNVEVEGESFPMSGTKK